MAKRVFLAHDPGGYDVIFPVYMHYVKTDPSAELYCIGPAARLSPSYAIGEGDFFAYLHELLRKEMFVLITGTSWGSDAELRAIRLCQLYHNPTVAILDYWSNYLLRLADQQQTKVFPDYYIVMDELAKLEAIRDGVPEGILYVLGHPGLDKFIELAQQPVSAPNKTKNALFLCQPLSHLYGTTLGYTEREALLDCILAVESTGWDFKVKFHPKDSPELIQEFNELEVTGQLLDLIPQYDLVISMNSMGLLHALLLGVPAISYQPGLCLPDMCITNKLDLTPLVTRYNDLLEILQDDGGLKHRIFEALDNAKETLPWLNGASAERICHFIERL